MKGKVESLNVAVSAGILMYLINMKNMLSYAADIRRPFGEKYRDVCPSPIFSATLKGCLESGKDYTAGGAKYNLATFSAVGFATLTDSLYAIKKAVYDSLFLILCSVAGIKGSFKLQITSPSYVFLALKNAPPSRRRIKTQRLDEYCDILQLYPIA